MLPFIHFRNFSSLRCLAFTCNGAGFHCCVSKVEHYDAGGDLRLISMPGYGTDAYLSIQYLEGQWEESRVEPQADAISTGGAAVVLP